MDWFCSLIRIAGASFPVASSLVQLNSEIESGHIRSRLEKLEDPISSLHPDIQIVSKKIYEAIKIKNSSSLDFEEEFYTNHSRPLATLEANGLVAGQHARGKRFACGLVVTDPSYIMYQCALFESEKSMSELFKTVDQCEAGKWLDGGTISSSLNVSLPVVNAVFDIFVNKGYGLKSREIGSSKYMGKV